MLRIAEEILLLVLDDAQGDVASAVPPHSLNIVLAGATLMALALENRVDTDLRSLTSVNPAPVGDALLDPALAEVAGEARTHSIAYWLERIATRGDEIRDQALAQLVERGILESDDPGLVFYSREVSRSRRYPPADDTATEEVRVRIMRLLFSEDIPDPRDIVIVSLAASCDLFKSILSRDELETVKERIDLISGMDLVGQSVARAVRQMKPRPAPPAARPPEEIPQVSGWPLLGSAFDVARDLSTFLVRQYRKSGPIFRFHALGRRFVVLAGPEANRFVQKQGSRHLRSYEAWRKFNVALGAKDSLLSLDGPGHVRMRKVHTKAFSRQFIEGRLDEVVEITRRMIARWPRNLPIGAQYAMQGIITEQIAMLVTGISAQDHFDELTDALDGLLRVHVLQRSPGWILRLPKHRRARRRLDRLYEKVLDHHRRDDRTDRDLIDDLIELRERDPQFFPETDLQLAVVGPFFAGIETSANTAAFMLYALLKHPELLARVRAEADACFDGESLRSGGLRELDVVHRVLMETLRTYPAAPALTRTVTNSFEFGGYTVPARATVIVGNTVAHHLPECFPEPDRFDIERYTPDRAEHRRPGAFAPFGLGTHRCLGSQFAEVQIALTLLTIVREVDLALDPPGYVLEIVRTLGQRPAPSFRFRVPDIAGSGRSAG